jgi:hypothetical protein
MTDTSQPDSKLLIIAYNNRVRQLAHHHAAKMVTSAHKLGRTFYSYKHQRDNNDETAYLGKISEIVILEWLTNNRVCVQESPLGDLAYERPETNFDGDFIIDTAAGAIRLELKTKTVNCIPQPHFDVGMSRINNSDTVLFTRIFEAKGLLYVVGWLPTTDFKKVSKFRAVGSYVKNTTNSDFVCNGNEFVCQISDLQSPYKLLEVLQ